MLDATTRCGSPCSRRPGSRCPRPPTAASRRSCACSATGLVAARPRRDAVRAARLGRRAPRSSTVLEAPHPDEIQIAQFEADHVARAFAAIDAAAAARRAVRRRSTTTSATPRSRWPTASRRRSSTRCTARSRGRLPLLRRARRARRASSRSRRRSSTTRRPRWAAAAWCTTRSTAREWPFQAEKDDFLLWIGRMSPDKGPHRAIAAAREAGRAARARRAGPAGAGGVLRRARSSRSSGDGVEYVGEADAERKRELYRPRARAADADPLARAVRARDGRGARLRHAGDRVPRGLGARGRRGRRDRASSSTTSTRWPRRSGGSASSTRPPAARDCEQRFGVAGGRQRLRGCLPRRHDRPARSGFCVRLGAPKAPRAGAARSVPTFRRNTPVQGTRRRLCAALVAIGCAIGVVACGGRRRRRAGRERHAAQPSGRPAAGQGLPARAHRVAQRGRRRSSARAPRSTTRWPRPPTSTTRAARGQARRRAGVRQAGPGAVRRREPGLRGDGGRRRRRPVARRLRRDHRRGRRQERPGERRPDHAQDAGRQDLRPARQLQLPDRDVRLRHRAEVRRQGRRARPRRRRQGQLRRGGAGRRLLRHRRARVREDHAGARRRREGVDARPRRTRSPRSSS